MDEPSVIQHGNDLVVGPHGGDYLMRFCGDPLEAVEIGCEVRIDGMHPVYFVSAPWLPDVWRVDAETVVWDALSDTVVEVADALRTYVERRADGDRDPVVTVPPSRD